MQEAGRGTAAGSPTCRARRLVAARGYFAPGFEGFEAVGFGLGFPAISVDSTTDCGERLASAAFRGRDDTPAIARRRFAVRTWPSLVRRALPPNRPVPGQGPPRRKPADAFTLSKKLLIPSGAICKRILPPPENSSSTAGVAGQIGSVPNRLVRGKPVGGVRPACARAPTQGASSDICRLKVRPDESFHVRPSAAANTRTSATPPSFV